MKKLWLIYEALNFKIFPFLLTIKFELNVVKWAPNDPNNALVGSRINRSFQVNLENLETQILFSQVEILYKLIFLNTYLMWSKWSPNDPNNTSLGSRKGPKK